MKLQTSMASTFEINCRDRGYTSSAPPDDMGAYCAYLGTL